VNADPFGERRGGGLETMKVLEVLRHEFKAFNFYCNITRVTRGCLALYIS
jgi:hypothetical protein